MFKMLYVLSIYLHTGFCNLYVDVIYAGVRSDAENLIAETCDANINRFISNRARSINRKSVAELFVDFVGKVNCYFVDYTFNWYW